MIKATSLTRRFGKLTAVAGLSFRVNEGETFGFLGPNGAGKTVAINMLTGQSAPTSGEVCVCGIDPTTLRTKKSFYRNIGVVPEHQNLYRRMSALENLSLFADLYGLDRKKADALLAELGLAEKRKTKVKHLSKGMRQKLLIARALLHDPKVLFLDEPTKGLDAHMARQIREMIKEFKVRGKTVFLSTHYIEEAEELCDRVAILHGGKIIAEGSPERLKGETGKGYIEIAFEEDQSVRLDYAELDRLDEVTAGRRIRHVKTHEPTLRDVFISLTGKEIHEEHRRSPR